MDMALNENNSIPFMKSLATCLSTMIKRGYTENFHVNEQGLQSEHEHNYSPEQVQTMNSFRFEGEADGDDKATIYVIETKDGTKGTLIDNPGIYRDSIVSRFMKKVLNIKKNS
jgi:hypothetical protein